MTNDRLVFAKQASHESTTQRSAAAIKHNQSTAILEYTYMQVYSPVLSVRFVSVKTVFLFCFVKYYIYIWRRRVRVCIRPTVIDKFLLLFSPVDTYQRHLRVTEPEPLFRRCGLCMRVNQVRCDHLQIASGSRKLYCACKCSLTRTSISSFEIRTRTDAGQRW